MVGNFVAEAFLAKIIVIAGGDLVGGSFLPENHERGVDGDAREPSCETGPAVKVRQVNKGPQEAVLHCVFRVLGASGDATRSGASLNLKITIFRPPIYQERKSVCSGIRRHDSYVDV